jgi:transposase InsO family protein
MLSYGRHGLPNKVSRGSWARRLRCFGQNNRLAHTETETSGLRRRLGLEVYIGDCTDRTGSELNRPERSRTPHQRCPTLFLAKEGRRVGRKAVSVEEKRLEILLAPTALGISVAKACERFRWSKTQFYEFQKRYREEGVLGLRDRSSRPRSAPRRTDVWLERMICELRVENPRWGSRRIRAELVRKGFTPPAASTIGRILQRDGLITPRPRKKKSFIRFERSCPNELWQIDAIEFALADGTPVWLINILDDFARFLVISRASFSVDEEAAREALHAAVSGYGVPREFLSDNALCFSGHNRGFVAALERELWGLGVKTIAARPRHPQTIGKTERMHRTQREWIEDRGSIATLEDLQCRADAFRWHYNDQRPHQSLGTAVTPRERYESLAPAGPDGIAATRNVLRKVQATGVVSYSGWRINLTTEWIGAVVEITEEGGKIRVSFGDELLTVVSTEEPKGFIGTGVRSGRPRKLPRRVPG